MIFKKYIFLVGSFFSFSFYASTWNSYLAILGTNSDSQAGSVSINKNANLIAVGEFSYNRGQGSVKVYKRIGKDLTDFGNVSAMVGSSSSQAGYSIGLNYNADPNDENQDKIIVVGEPKYDSNKGRVRIFKYDQSDDIWKTHGDFDSLVGDTAGNKFGSYVVIDSDGTTIVVGEPGYNNHTGRATVYQLSGGVWGKVGSDIIGNADNSYAGICVGINSDGTRIIVGESRYGNNNGRVRVYSLSGGTLTQVGQDLVGDQSAFAGLSVGINLEGDIIAFGEPGHNNYKGRTRSYKYNNFNSAWEIYGHDNDMEGTGVTDQPRSGSFVSINGAGDIIAVGDFYRSLAKVYYFNNGSWIQLGNSDKISGSKVNNDFFTNLIQISSDGKLLFFGDPKYSNNRGAIRIYARSNLGVFPSNFIVSPEFIISFDLIISPEIQQISKEDLIAKVFTYINYSNIFQSVDFSKALNPAIV